MNVDPFPARGVDERQSSLAVLDKEGEEDLEDSSSESDNSRAAAPREVSTVAVEETIEECLMGERAVGL